MKTFSAKPHEVKRDWFVVDAADKVLGRFGCRGCTAPSWQAQAGIYPMSIRVTISSL